MRGLFVTATGTEIGKTVVAAVLARAAAARGERVAVFKPALSGLDDPGEPDHEILRRASGTSQSDDEIAPYRFGPPTSPHLAAELAGLRIDPERLLAGAADAGREADLLVVEGVGGWLVPLTADYLVRDFAVALGYPVVVVAAPGLGTINHALLTIESIRQAGLRVEGVVLNPWPAEPGTIERSNLETIARLGGVGVETLARLEVSDSSSWPELALGGVARRRGDGRR